MSTRPAEGRPDAPPGGSTGGAWWRRFCWLALVVVVIDAYAVVFTRRERTLYRADQVRHWAMAANLADGFSVHPLATVDAVARSVAHAQVNALAALPVAAVMALAGESRAVFLLSILDLYGLAVVVLLLGALGSLVRRVGRGPPAPLVVEASWAVTLVLFAGIWRPVFGGSVGLGGVAISIALLWLYFDRGEGELASRSLAGVALLLVALFLFRRWFAFSAVAFAALVVVDAAAGALHRRDWSAAGLWRCARTPFAVGGGAAVLLVVLAAPVTLEMLTTDYAGRFVAYRSAYTWPQRLHEAVAEHGWLVLGAIALSALALALARRTRRIALLLTLQIVVTYSLFERVQDHGAHHWYLYAGPAMLLVGLALRGLLERLAGGVRRVVALVVLALAALVPARLFAGLGEPLAGPRGGPLPRPVVRPAVRTDLSEVTRLLRLLDRLLAARPAYVYVAADSDVLSDHTLAFANLSLGTAYRAPAFVLQSAHVDRRDGFPRALLEAGYVAVASPVQYHLRPEDQRVVGCVAESFLEGEGVARAFRRLPEAFALEGGVEVLVFVRVRPLAPDEIGELSERLRAAYPHHPEIYQP